ncbi:MAG: DUF1207 domain-containing protein [Spirochaetes bacterium]|nr:DUF1207 domain-containing protein [Spirochaetota bacterium]
MSRPITRIIMLFSLLTVCPHLPAADIEFFSSDKVSGNPHGALLRAPSLNALYLYSAADTRQYMEYDFGARIPGISYRSESVAVDIGGGGGIFTRFDLLSESFNFIHADFTGALFTDVRYRNFLFETTVYHTSSHLGDDYIKYSSGAVRNTGFEAVRHYISYMLSCLQLSIGLDWKFSRRPKKKIFGEPSILAGVRIDLLSAGIPFFVEWEAEIIAGRRLPNFGIRTGIYLKYFFNTCILRRKSGGSEPHELSVYYYSGYSKMGCFYDRRETLVMVGPSYRY